MAFKKQKENHFSEEKILDAQNEFINIYQGQNTEKIKPLKLLFKLYKGHYLRLLLAVFLYLIKNSPTWILPLITADVINLATNPPENAVRRIIIDLSVSLVLLIINIPIHTIYSQIFSNANRSVEAGLRGAMIRKLQQLSITFHKDTESGKIQSKVMRDVEIVTDLASHIFNTVINSCFNMIITLFIVITQNISVFLMLLLMVPSSVFLRMKFHKRMHRETKEFRKEIENTASAVYDMEELIPVTRAHSLEDAEIKKLTHNITKIAEKGFKFDFTQNIFGAANWAILNIFQIACLFITVFLAFKKYISIGEISLYQSYFSSLSGNIISIVFLLPAISRGTDAIRSMGEILSEEDIEKNVGKPKLSELKGNFEFKDVCFNYTDDTKVLDHLNLKVKAGETIALVGESGAGKTTMINLVIGFNLAQSGQVLIDGKDINEFDLRSYRSMISVVPQNSILFSGTLRENITYGKNDYSEEEIMAAVRAAQLESVIEKLPQGIDTLVGEHGAKLSGGQRQRVSIARAIIRNPRVIIFDEATSALDSVTEREIQLAIDNLTRNRTTFMVAHRLSTIKNADKIAVIKDGSCVEYGAYDDLIAKKGEFWTFKEIQS